MVVRRILPPFTALEYLPYGADTVQGKHGPISCGRVSLVALEVLGTSFGIGGLEYLVAMVRCMVSGSHRAVRR